MKSRFEPLLSMPAELLQAIDKMDGYKKFCASKLAECDRALSDIDHLIELCKLDAVHMMRAVRKRKEILLERRFYKDEADRANAISQVMPNSQSVHQEFVKAIAKVKEINQHADTREYTPRVLFDIFDYDEQELANQKQRREDVTKLGKKASKKALRLEGKFREIQS